MSRLAGEAGSGPEAVASALALAALTHDWGKSLTPYQEYVRGRHAHAPIRHEVASFVAITNMLEPVNEGALPCYLALTGAVLYHHHGLYDFVGKIVKYLRGGVRAWPDVRRYGAEVRARLEALARALSNYLSSTPAGGVIKLREGVGDLIESMSEDGRAPEAFARPCDVEELVNDARNVVTPALAALMIGDNVSAGVARAGGGLEGVRVLKMVKASAPALLIRHARVRDALKLLGLKRYAEGLGRVYEAVLQG